MGKVRKPAFAGKFYPDQTEQLNRLISDIDKMPVIDETIIDKQIIGGVAPHAGYVYSAHQAVPLYRLIRESGQVFETLVIVNPNHRGLGAGAFNTCGYQYWETPFGKIPVDTVFSEELEIAPYPEAHNYEHSGEVQLPLLQYFFTVPFQVVMITMNGQTDQNAKILASKIRKACDRTGRRILLIASSDFSHYETPECGFKKDQFVVEEILKFNTEGVYEQVKKHHVSVCGYGPIMTLMEFTLLSTKNPGATIIKRGHSGEVSPSDQVVDYISMLFFNEP